MAGQYLKDTIGSKRLSIRPRRSRARIGASRKSLALLLLGLVGLFFETGFLSIALAILELA